MHLQSALSCHPPLPPSSLPPSDAFTSAPLYGPHPPFFMFPPQLVLHTEAKDAVQTRSPTSHPCLRFLKWFMTFLEIKSKSLTQPVPGASVALGCAQWTAFLLLDSCRSHFLFPFHLPTCCKAHPDPLWPVSECCCFTSLSGIQSATLTPQHPWPNPTPQASAPAALSTWKPFPRKPLLHVFVWLLPNSQFNSVYS